MCDTTIRDGQARCWTSADRGLYSMQTFPRGNRRSSVEARSLLVRNGKKHGSPSGRDNSLLRNFFEQEKSLFSGNKALRKIENWKR